MLLCEPSTFKQCSLYIFFNKFRFFNAFSLGISPLHIQYTIHIHRCMQKCTDYKFIIFWKYLWFSVFTAWQSAKVSTPSCHFTVHHLTSVQEVHNICLLEMGCETPREWFSIYRELMRLICTTLICEIQLLHGWSSERQDLGPLKEVKKASFVWEPVKILVTL